jgi:hypothetical protein
MIQGVENAHGQSFGEPQLLLPPVEDLFGCSCVPTHFHHHAHLNLLQYANNLLYRKTLSPHGQSPFFRSDSAGN